MLILQRSLPGTFENSFKSHIAHEPAPVPHSGRGTWPRGEGGCPPSTAAALENLNSQIVQYGAI